MPRFIRAGKGEKFGTFNGQHPDTFLALHKEGRLVALATTERAAVWDLNTRELAWDPGIAASICWDPEGDELYVLRQEDPEYPGYHCKLERRSWPGNVLISEGEVRLPGLFPVMAVSPTREFVAIHWMDQSPAGYEVVKVLKNRLTHHKPGSYTTSGGTNSLSGPVFSPDGSRIVCAVGFPRWWRKDGGKCEDEDDWMDEEDPEFWRAEAEHEPIVGEVVICPPDDSDGGLRVRIKVKVKKGFLVSAGVHEEELVPELFEMLSEPAFIDNDTFEVILPNLENLRFDLRGKELARTSLAGKVKPGDWGFWVA
ncbi:MAG TPA: hypothetical protein VI893_09230 [Thermoplasmata archaeon]|nr:hypothetical protein [Thermoplasmata archaeon]